MKVIYGVIGVVFVCGYFLLSAILPEAGPIWTWFL